MGKKKLNRKSRKQAILSRNEALRKKWSTEEHAGKPKKTEGYLRRIGSESAKQVKSISIARPGSIKTHGNRKHRKVKRRSNKKVNGVVTPELYIAQQKSKKKQIENQDRHEHEGARKNTIRESVVANAFIMDTPSGTSNRKKKIVRHKIENNYRYVGAKNKDFYDFAGEYQARNVEYGHGRKKSREWNDQAALNLKDELAELKRLREEGWID